MTCHTYIWIAMLYLQGQTAHFDRNLEGSTAQILAVKYSFLWKPSADIQVSKYIQKFFVRWTIFTELQFPQNPDT